MSSVTDPNAAADLISSCLSILQQNDQAGNATALIGCVAEKVERNSRTVLVVYAAALVFFMQAGFAMVCAGAVRKKNVQNTLLKNLLDACGASVAWFTVG